MSLSNTFLGQSGSEYIVTEKLVKPEEVIGDRPQELVQPEEIIGDKPQELLQPVKVIGGRPQDLV